MRRKQLLLFLLLLVGTQLLTAQHPYIGKHKLYYGAAYYPEAWPDSCVDDDIRRMKEAHVNVVRMAEFAWSKMEPTEGHYDFEWLHRVIRKLHAASIDVILGTPTATPPAWLGAKHPEIYLTTENGEHLTHGARRNCSYTNRVYQDYCRRICERMAQEFGAEPGVIGWQTDNEMTLTSDFSEETRQQWVQWLTERYGTVDNLNRLWNLNLWSQAYSSFDQVPMPMKPVWHHPSLVYAWREFTTQKVIDFQQMQVDILRRHSRLPITHDGMPGQTIDYERLFAPLDFPALNIYHSFEAYDLVQSNYDRMRGMKKGMHWLFETAPNNSGGGDNGSTWFLHQIPGSLKAALWMNYASGAQGTMFWLWRQQWAGHEVPHGAMISAWGKPAANWQELVDMGADLERTSATLMDNPVAPARAAIFFSHAALNGLGIEKFANGLRYYQDWSYRFFRPMADNYIFRDVIYPGADLTQYSLLFMPLMPYIPDELQHRLEAWVAAGGTLLVGPMTGYRTREWTHFTDRQMGAFERWMGITVESFLPIGTERREREIPFMLDFAPSLHIDNHEAALWSLALSSKHGQTIATYLTGHHAGRPAIIENRIGRGRVVLFGTDPGRDAMGRLLLHYAAVSGITPDAKGDPGVVVVPRQGKRHGIALVNITSKPRTLHLNNFNGRATDVLTGITVDASLPITLQPYETRLIFR